MAFDTKLLKLASQPGLSTQGNIYSYASADSFATFSAAGYFNSATNLKSGDKLIIVDSSGNSYNTTVSVSGGVVTLLYDTAIWVPMLITNISTAQTRYILPPKGTVVQFKAILQGTITVANTTITPKQGSNTLTGSVITVATTDVAGAIYTTTPTANNVFDGATPLQLVAAGGSTGATDLQVFAKVIGAVQ